MANTCDGNRIPHTLSSATLPGNELRRARPCSGIRGIGHPANVL